MCDMYELSARKKINGLKNIFTSLVERQHFTEHQAQEVQAGMQWGTDNTADDSNDDDDDDGEVEDPDRALARATIIWRLNKTLQ